MEVKGFWSLINAKRKLRIERIPARLIHRVAVLLTNFHNCKSANSISHYFRVEPLTLEEYILSRDGAPVHGI